MDSEDCNRPENAVEPPGEENDVDDENNMPSDKDDTTQHSLTPTTTREEIVQTDDESAFVQLPQKITKRSWTQYRRLVFILGCVMGIILAWAFRSPDLQLEGLLDSVDMADFFDDLKAALPSALPIGLVREAKEIQEHSRQRASSTGAFSIGEQMFQEGLSANYPVVMVRSKYCHPN